MQCFTLGASWPTGTCGPRRDLNAKRIICLLANIKSIKNVRTPKPMMITTVTPDNSSVIFFGFVNFSTCDCIYVLNKIFAKIESKLITIFFHLWNIYNLFVWNWLSNWHRTKSQESTLETSQIVLTEVETWSVSWSLKRA